MLVLVWKARKHMCGTDCLDMTLAVKVALNTNTTNQQNDNQKVLHVIPSPFCVNIAVSIMAKAPN